MKIFNYLYLSLLFFSFLFLSSCEKEEDTIDLREEIIGTYDYRVKFYETHQGIGYLGADQDGYGTMIATKKGNDKVEFKVDNEILFTAVGFKDRPERPTGISFDLVDDSDVVEGQNVKVVGDYRIDFNGINYQGVYYPTSNELKMAQKVTYLIDRFPVTVVAITEAKKQ